MIDCHAHLATSDFDEDRELVLERARVAGVETLTRSRVVPAAGKAQEVRVVRGRRLGAVPPELHSARRRTSSAREGAVRPAGSGSYPSPSSSGILFGSSGS